MKDESIRVAVLAKRNGDSWALVAKGPINTARSPVVVVLPSLPDKVSVVAVRIVETDLCPGRVVPSPAERSALSDAPCAAGKRLGDDRFDPWERNVPRAARTTTYRRATRTRSSRVWSTAAIRGRGSPLIENRATVGERK